MNRNRLFQAAAGSALALSAVTLGLAGIAGASAAAPDTAGNLSTGNACLVTIPNDPTGTVLQNPTACPDPTSAMPASAIGAPLFPSGAAQTIGVPVGVPLFPVGGSQFVGTPTVVTTIPTILAPTAAVAVNESTFLALTAQQLGVSQSALIVAFEQAEPLVLTQGQSATSQTLLLSLVAQQLGVSLTTLNAALQQAANTEINLLWQSGQISFAQASADETALASGQYGLGLGFGIPAISAPAV